MFAAGARQFPSNCSMPASPGSMPPSRDLNATIWVDREGAYASARAADAARSAGARSAVLHGVPLAHKDMYYQAGRRCTCGSAIRRGFRARCPRRR